MANTPKDPNNLSLSPSRSGGTGGSSDFGNVRSGGGTKPGSGPTGKPDFSNVVSNADSEPARGSGSDTYTVRSGDTLSAIAERHYGKAGRWHEIFEANRDQIDDPDLIRPGQVLRLPSA